MPLTTIMAAAIRYTLLLLYLMPCAASTTLLLYLITKSAWAACLILASTNTLFLLENCALISEDRRKDQEIEVLKRTQSDVLLKKIRILQSEVDRLKRVEEKQKMAISHMKRGCSLEEKLKLLIATIKRSKSSAF